MVFPIREHGGESVPCSGWCWLPLTRTRVLIAPALLSTQQTKLYIEFSSYLPPEGWLTLLALNRRVSAVGCSRGWAGACPLVSRALDNLHFVRGQREAVAVIAFIGIMPPFFYPRRSIFVDFNDL